MADNREYFYTREWLNKEHSHSTAAIYGEVSRESHREKPSQYDIYASLSISDCTRSIALAFDFSDGDDMRNNVHKLDTLIGSFEEFKAAMIAAWSDYKKELAEYEAKESLDS